MIALDEGWVRPAMSGYRWVPTLNRPGDAPMGYDYHIGVDYHKSYSHIVVQDAGGKMLRSGRVKNDGQSLASFLGPYRENAHAVMEATRNWTVMYDWLDEICDEVVLAHPLKVKAIAEAKIKTDKIDATILSHLLRADLVPKAHAPSHRARDLRSALRERMFFVRLRTMVKNRITTAFDRYPEETAQLRQVTDLFGVTGRKQLAALAVSDLDRIQIDRGLAFVDNINQQIKDCERTIKLLSKGNANVRLLKTLPGVGEFFARLIDAEIDDIHRFASAEKLAAYAGIVPSTYSSGGKTFNGRIIKQGNKWLRWAFVEAVVPAITHDLEFRAYYERLKAAKGANRAKVATARRLLTIAFRMLRDGRCYEQRGPNKEVTPSRLS